MQSFPFNYLSTYTIGRESNLDNVAFPRAVLLLTGLGLASYLTSPYSILGFTFLSWSPIFFIFFIPPPPPPRAGVLSPSQRPCSVTGPCERALPVKTHLHLQWDRVLCTYLGKCRELEPTASCYCVWAPGCATTWYLEALDWAPY